MKPTRIITIMALFAIFVCCTSSTKKEVEAVENSSVAVDPNIKESTPLDVKSFGLLGDVKKVLLSIRESSEDTEEDAWESNDSLQLAFDEAGRIVRDNYENIYKYDDKGNFIEGLSEKSKMNRDEKGHVVYYENIMDEEDDSGFSMKYAYDEQDRMKKVEIGGWEATTEITLSYTGDNIYPDSVNWETDDEGDHYSLVITYTYKTFDDKGNWTEREAHSVSKHTGEDNEDLGTTKLKRTEKRKIEYYQR